VTWARERAEESNLPIVEVPDVNPDLESRSFEAPGIYVVVTEFDELDPRETRVFRRW